MNNLRMEEKLKAHEAIDVSEVGTPMANWPEHWALPKFIEGVDYCDSKTESWIWSIGKNRLTGAIVASTSTDLYQNPAFESLFLR